MADSTTAQIGATVDLAFWDTSVSPDAYTDLGQIRSIAGVGETNPEVDSTTLDSTAAEFIAGLAVGDQVTIVFTTGATNTHIDRLRTWVQARTAITFKLTVGSPATEVVYFNLVPLHHDLGTITPGGLMELSFQGRITGGLTPTNPHI